MQLKLNISELVIIVLIALLQDHSSSGFNPEELKCKTPDHEWGYCLPYKQNYEYVQYLSSVYSRRDLIDFLRRSICHKNGAESICANEFFVTANSFYGSHEYTSRFDERGLNILSSIDCGRAQNKRISFGIDAAVEEFPWMALIEYNGNEENCGGSLISNRYVLTAAHCLLDKYEITGVILGEQNLDTDPDCEVRKRRKYCTGPRERFGIEKIMRHPEYNRYYIRNDVGLIKLSSEVIFRKHIVPICLPLTPFSTVLPMHFIIAGWGTTETGFTSRILQKALVKYRDREVCQQAFRFDNINSQHLCMGGQGPVDNCRGDSGGPLFNSVNYLPLRARYVQYGIVSNGGANCSILNKPPAIYTNVMEFMPWITSQIEE